MGKAVVFVSVVIVLILDIILIASGDTGDSVCASPPDIRGAITPQLEGTEHALGTPAIYRCGFGFVSRNSRQHISVCRINAATSRAEWTDPKIECIPRSCGDPGYVNNGRRLGNKFTFPNRVEYECEEGYKLLGSNVRYCQSTGEWSGKLPTCDEIDEDEIISTTEESKVSPRECFCTYDYENDLVQVRTRNKMLRRGDTLKLGEVVYMSCKPGYKHLKWKNGFQISGIVQMTCRMCKKWQEEDLPTCQREIRDTFIVYERNLEVLPGGIIDVPMGGSRRFGCRSFLGVPIWNFGRTPNSAVNTLKLSDRGTTSYVSYLDVVQAVEMNSGEYECFVPDEYGSHVGSTIMYLQVNDRATSIIEPGVTPSALKTPPNIINVESSSYPTSDIRGHEDCFCSYEYEDELVNAYIGSRILKFGDWIRRGEVVSFECKFQGKVLTWQNGLRLSGKANVACNTCKKWEREDVPICKNLERNDAVISYDNNFLPGGIINVQKQETQRFSCSNNWRQPDWDYGQRRGVSVSKTQVRGRGSDQYISYLDIDNDADDIDGEYKCYMIGIFSSQRFGSTSLHLQVNEPDIYCPPIDESKFFSLIYSNGRRINSTVRFFCKDRGKRFEGRNYLICLPNGTWSGSMPKCVDYVSCPKFADSSELLVNYSKGGSVGSVATFNCSATTRYLIGRNYSVCQENGNWSNPLPSCEDPKCSIHDLAISLPEGIEPDMSDVTEEYVMFGSKVMLICTDKSEMSGDSQARCGEHGKWKLGNFQCVLGCILNLDPSSHLLVRPRKGSYWVGESVLLSCPRGEEMSAKVERVMCLPSGWSDSLPECKEPGYKDDP